MDVDAINSLALGTRKKATGHQVHEMVVSSAVETIFRKTAMSTSHHAKAMARRAHRVSHGPRVLVKDRSKKVWEMEDPKVPRMNAQGSYKGKSSSTGFIWS